MTPQALAVVATLVSFAPHGNRVDLKLDRGSAELVWISASAFRLRRTLDGPLPDAWIDPPVSVPIQYEDTPAALHLRSKLLDVELRKQGLLVKVTGPDGVVLMADLSEAKPDGDGIGWERQAGPGVRFYGLDATDDMELDLRGKKIDSRTSFLMSTAGYGEQHWPAAHFDFTAPDRYRIQSAQVDYYFFYGPKPKDLLKQRIPMKDLTSSLYRRPATWNGLRSRLLETVHHAMGDPEMAPLTFADEDKAPEELKTRIRQLASLTLETPLFLQVSTFRKQLASFFNIYEIETRDKHYPIWRPLPFQFPTDPEGAHHADEFTLGDEMLVAPIYEAGNKRRVYFPPGAWTSLETNREYPGRSSATIETTALPVFAHNGAIVPLDSSGGIALHYFPSLGGEFFLLEKDLGEYTQVHAAPAADVMRLEIESKKDRDYEWVVHHVERPTKVAFEDRLYTWTYNAELKNLFVRVSVKAGEDNVIHVTW